MIRSDTPHLLQLNQIPHLQRQESHSRLLYSVAATIYRKNNLKSSANSPHRFYSSSTNTISSKIRILTFLPFAFRVIHFFSSEALVVPILASPSFDRLIFSKATNSTNSTNSNG